jgi:hypothetical protein
VSPSERARRARRVLRDVFSLPPGDGAALALASALLAWYRLRLALPLPIGGTALLHRRIVASAAAPSMGDAPPRPEPAEPLRLTRLVQLFRRAADAAVLGAGCQPRSLALARLLQLNGLHARIRVGIRRSPEGFTGHAWVEHHGAVVSEREDFVRSFVPLPLPRAATSGDAG